VAPAVIWAILVALGIPLWLCALGILMLLLQNRRLRRRYGDLPVRVKLPGKKRWTRGHAVWVSDVFAWRASPAAWNEDLIKVNSAALRDAEHSEQKKLRRLGDDPVIATLAFSDGEVLEVAAEAARRSDLLGPFAAAPGVAR
jgi:hypothetical protein